MGSQSRVTPTRTLDVVIQSHIARVIQYRTAGPSFTFTITLGAEDMPSGFIHVRQLDAGSKIAARSATFEHDWDRSAPLSPAVH